MITMFGLLITMFVFVTIFDGNTIITFSLRRQVAAIDKMTSSGMAFWDYGNAFLLEASRAGQCLCEIQIYNLILGRKNQTLRIWLKWSKNNKRQCSGFSSSLKTIRNSK